MKTKPKQANGNLHAAKREKNDEFYTRMQDIAPELYHYRDYFHGKTVYCNCDDPEHSHFWQYFALNFETLGLVRLVATHYARGQQSYKLELTGYGGTPVRTELEGDGDFRSPECVEILKGADIVATNPPFSLFREYVAQLVEHDKQFVIVGNCNAITYKEIFKLIKENRMWLGVSPRSMMFRLPDASELLVNACWFTNLVHKRRKEEILLWRTYEGNEALYPKYDNYDAIEVSKVKDIPCDFDGVMGVPITFLEKYNPEQFEIIKFRKGTDERDLAIAGKCPYFRILIKRR